MQTFMIFVPFLFSKVNGFSPLDNLAKFWSYHFDHQGFQNDEKFMETKDYKSEVKVTLDKVVMMGDWPECET